MNVRSAAGPAEDGSHVVVTVPLGVLKDRRLHGVAGRMLDTTPDAAADWV